MIESKHTAQDFNRLIEHLTDLETRSLALEPKGAERAVLFEQFYQYAAQFLDEVNQLPAYVETEDRALAMHDQRIEEAGASVTEALSLIEELVDTPGLNPASGGHLAYVPGGGLPLSAMGDLLAAVTNRYAGVFYGSPGAVRLENLLIKWMAELIGFPDTTLGNLTSGGSIANLIAVVTARDAKQVKGERLQKAVIYTTEQAHHCLTKALRIAGLSDTTLRFVEMDERYRMRVDRLQELIEKDIENDLFPFMVLASAGTTDTGSVDPMSDIAAICKAHEIWLHVDAAYGGFFILCEQSRGLLQGMSQADSVVLDPHKGLFLPYGTGAILIKNGKALAEAHYYQANYLQDALAISDEPSPADLSPELTKHFRGLRMWLPLKIHGVAPFRACLDEKLALAQYAWLRLQAMPKFQTAEAPELSIVIFRYQPDSGNGNAENKHIVDEIRKEGSVFISSTIIEGRFTLRLAILSFRTHKSTIDMFFDRLQQITDKFAD